MEQSDSQAVKKLSGLERSALLMLGLGEQHAAEILRHMGPKEVQEIGLAMASLTHVTNSQMELVMQKFVGTIGEQTSLAMGSDQYIRNMLNSALGADKAGGIIDRILLGKNSKGLEQLKWMDARAIAELIRLEHPQIIATILVHLERDHASEILSLFPERLRNDTLLRIATLDSIQPMALRELNDVLAQLLSGGNNIRKAPMGGIRAAAEILNFIQ